MNDNVDNLFYRSVRGKAGKVSPDFSDIMVTVVMVVLMIWRRRHG